MKLDTIKRAVKYDIEISGPSKTICDIPVNNNNDTNQIMSIDVLEGILNAARNEEVLLVNLILNSVCDVLKEEVAVIIDNVKKGVSAGTEISLSFPIDMKDVFIENVQYIKDLLITKDIDLTHYYVDPTYFKEVGSSLGKLAKEMAFTSIHDSKIHTMFPTDEATQNDFLTGIKEYYDAADVWKIYRVEFINSFEVRQIDKYKDFINSLNKLAETTYSFLPPIPERMLSAYEQVENFIIRPGTCLGGTINVAYDLEGTRKKCLTNDKMCYF